MFKMLVILISILLYVGAATTTSNLTGPDYLRNKFINLELDLWKKLQENTTSSNNNIRADIALMAQYKNFDETLQKEIPYDISYGVKPLESTWIWAKMYVKLKMINMLYASFQRFESSLTTKGTLQSRTFEDLAKTISDKAKHVFIALKDLNKLIYEENFYQNIAEEIKKLNLCEAQLSKQQFLMQLYSYVAITELKGYSATQISFMLLTIYKQGDYAKAANFKRGLYVGRAQFVTKLLRNLMESSNRKLWRCDPNKYIKDQTYSEITELLQGHIENEKDLSQKDTCGETCPDYTYTRSFKCTSELLCKSQRACSGKIVNCRYYDEEMKICPGDQRDNRRYEYVDFKNGVHLGKSKRCSSTTRVVESWLRGIFRCHYCFCLCDQPGPNSDRYISLKPAFSDMSNNKIIHLQVQEGTLKPRGIIDPATVQWVPINQFKITDRGIYSNQDYQELNFKKRAIDLEDLETKDGHLVTGVRFRSMDSLRLEIYITPFNFATGELEQPHELSCWTNNLGNANCANNQRKEFKLESPDIPTRTPAPSIIMPSSCTYIKFTNSDYVKDAAQTTVPFIDTQNVESLIPVPVTGVSIYYKGRNRYGGFIGPSINTYDYSKHF